MPTSDASCISTITCEIMRLKPRRVLDVGPGYGKYGFLCREYLGPGLKLDAVEPWPQALLCAELYDDVVAGTFPENLIDTPYPRFETDPYDLVLLVDVIEHYEFIDGIQALTAALVLAPHVLISTPHRPAPQGSVGGNVFEAHVSQWTFEMFEGLSCMATLLADHSEQLLVSLDRAAL